MAEFVLKYADGRGQIHQQVATAGTEKELRDRYTTQGFLIYSVKPRAAGALAATGMFGGRKKLNLEKFLIFNQQFVTLIRAGLPILKGLDLLAERLTDPKLEPYIKSVRDEVRGGTLLSDAFRQQSIFPKIYISSVMAGEKSGSLTEVLDRYIHYQKLALAVRKKVLLSLLYPCVLIVLVCVLMVFLVTYVVPTFATLYSSMQATLPQMTEILIAVGTTVVRSLETAASMAAEQGGEAGSRDRVLAPYRGATRIFIRPGHKFRVVDAMLTNFHLPESTLLMLCAAFVGRETLLAAYAHAVQARYRFFSYGDAMFLTPSASALASASETA